MTSQFTLLGSMSNESDSDDVWLYGGGRGGTPSVHVVPLREFPRCFYSLRWRFFWRPLEILWMLHPSLRDQLVSRPVTPSIRNHGRRRSYPSDKHLVPSVLRSTFPCWLIRSINGYTWQTRQETVISDSKILSGSDTKVIDTFRVRSSLLFISHKVYINIVEG